MQSAHFVVSFAACSFLLNNSNLLTPRHSQGYASGCFVWSRCVDFVLVSGGVCSRRRGFYTKVEMSAFDVTALHFCGFPPTVIIAHARTHTRQATTTAREQTERLVRTDGPQVTR